MGSLEVGNSFRILEASSHFATYFFHFPIHLLFYVAEPFSDLLTVSISCNGRDGLPPMFLCNIVLAVWVLERFRELKGL